MSNDLDDIQQNRMSILEHLHELRKRLVVCLWASGIGMVACFVFAQDIFDFLVSPMNEALEEQAARLEHPGPVGVAMNRLMERPEETPMSDGDEVDFTVLKAALGDDIDPLLNALDGDRNAAVSWAELAPFRTAMHAQMAPGIDAEPTYEQVTISALSSFSTLDDGDGSLTLEETLAGQPKSITGPLEGRLLHHVVSGEDDLVSGHEWATAAHQMSGTGGQPEKALATMAITDPMEGIITYLKVALLAGLLAASPVIFYQLWAFVAPGLYKRERKTVVPLVIASTGLFLGGASFGYFIIFQYGFSFFLGVIDPAETSAVLSINSYLITATKLLMAFGFAFQLPVVIFFLARIGLLDHKDMIRGFRYAMVGIFVLAAAITPPDPMTQSLMAAPLTLLYTLSIGIAWAFTTKKREEEPA